MEENLREKEEERRKKLDLNFKDPDDKSSEKIN